jgi:Rrf2 family iron-sulfur cluster assembly transcriptional regulator
MYIIRRDRVMTAISLMLDIAFHVGRAGTVNAADVAERLGLARRGMEPLLQVLSRAGLLASLRGPKGGYRLGRPPRDIRLAEIVDLAITEDEEPTHGPEGQLQNLVVDPLFVELDEMIGAGLKALTLDDLLRRAANSGLRRPAVEPISFAI